MPSYIESVRELAPLRLNIDVESPDGAHARWGWDDPNPANAPMGLSFSTTMPGGFERMTCSLERDPRLSYPDLAELSTITVQGAGGDIAWQGRLEKIPDTGGFQAQVSPEAVGWQAHLEDDSSAQEIFVDRELSKWEGASVPRKISLLEGGIDEEDGTVGSSTTNPSPALITQIVGAWARKRISESWYRGNGIQLGSIYYAWQKGPSVNAADGNWVWLLHSSTTDAIDSESNGTGNLRAEGPSSGESNILTISPNITFALAQFVYLAAAGSSGIQYPIYWTTLAVYGRHGLTLYGTNGTSEAKGVLASDAVAYALGKWAPKLAFSTGSEGTIKPTSFVIPQLVFPTPTTVAEMLKQATRFELEDWAVWEGPAFYMNPRGEGGKEWRARVGPAQLQEAGPQVAKLWNGVIVTYTDVTGVTRTAGPLNSGMNTTSPLLEDTDPENPLNEAGIKRWASLTMGTTTPAGAEKVGATFLRESKALETSGQATLVGHVEDETGTLWPAWKVRAGDTVSFVDASDPSPRRIVNTSYDDSTKSNTIQLDQPPDSLQALLERLSVVLAPLGLS
jgi:hypothetical protein